MQSKLRWMLAALAALGGTARADDFAPRAEVITLGATVDGGSHRGVSQDYVVLPEGGELTGQMRFITTDEAALGGEKLKFSDLALFGISGRWSVFERLEIAAQVDLLPKQPSSTSEKPWQSVGLGLRSALGRRVAISLNGAGGHLIDHAGLWTRETMAVEWRKPISKILTYDVTGGIDGIALAAPHGTSAFITEVAASTSALFRDPEGFTGLWVGLTYALPVSARGTDPTTQLAVDPQPRLDFRIGGVLSLVKSWDLFAEFAVVDRGDIANPATRLPILDGGFDQRQIVFGVTRHVQPDGKRHRRDDDRLGAR